MKYTTKISLGLSLILGVVTLISGCASTTGNLQRASAMSIGNGVNQHGISISNVNRGAMDVNWVATTGEGVSYNCSADDMVRRPYCSKSSGAKSNQYKKRGTISSSAKKGLDKIYKAECQGCHGSKHEGALGSDLRPNMIANKDANTLAQIIINGKSGTAMPSFKMSKANADAMVAYLQNFGKKKIPVASKVDVKKENTQVTKENIFN